MEIFTMPLGAYQTNCYLVWGAGDTCVVIDPGYQPQDVLAQAANLGKTVGAILLTHGHFDHVGGVKEIAEKTGCPVYVSEEELTLDPRMTAGPLFYTHTYGQTFTLGDLFFQILPTPGHTPGSVCLICGDTMFSGDTLFVGSIGRTDFPGSNPKQMWQSLSLLEGLDKDYTVLPGHGEATTLFEEKRSNPFLQNL